MGISKKQTELIHCNKCGGKTAHKRIASHTQDSDVPVKQDDVYWTTIYDMLECAGCRDVALRKRSYFSEWNRGDVDESFHPPRIVRRLPKWIDQLSEQLGQLLVEVYAALQVVSRRLAMMGARALIDMVSLQKVGDVGSFGVKLKALQQNGFLSDRDCDVLHAAIDVGNAASHRGYSPARKHANQVMDIVENLLVKTLLESRIKDLKKTTPQRTRKKKMSEKK